MSNVNPTIEDKFTAFCSWVEKITGRPVIKARRRMNTQLKVPYCSVDLLAGKMVPKDLEIYSDSSPDTADQPIHETIRGLMLVTFQVTALGGKDAMDVIHRLIASFKIDSWFVFSKKYSFGNAGIEDGMENISSEFLGAAFENRAQMKASFYIPVPVTFDEDYFTSCQLKTLVAGKKSDECFDDIYGKRYDQ